MHLLSELAMMIEEYVAALNEPGRVPEVGSIWKLVIQRTFEEAYQESLSLYNKNMGEVELPVEFDDLLAEHEKSFTIAEDFLEKLSGIDNEMLHKFITKLNVILTCIYIANFTCIYVAIYSYKYI